MYSIHLLDSSARLGMKNDGAVDRHHYYRPQGTDMRQLYKTLIGRDANLDSRDTVIIHRYDVQ